MAAVASYNPFSETVRDRYFVGREKQQQQFMSHLEGLRAGVPNHIFLAGRDGTGKTFFLRRMQDLSAQGGFVAVPVMLDEKRTPVQQTAGIMREMIKQLDLAVGRRGGKLGLLADWEKGESSKVFNFPRLAGDAPSSNLMREDFERLESEMVPRGIPGMVVCLDEGQYIHPSAMSALKASLQQCHRFLVVLSVRILPSTLPPSTEGRALLEEKARQAGGDFGAAAFYVAGIDMGAFESDAEAGDCIRRRLEDNRIQFDDDVIRDIAAIERRLPRGIVRLSSSVYSEAASDGAVRARARHLTTVFESAYPEQLTHMAAILAQRPEFVRQYLNAVAGAPAGATSRGLAESIYPNLPEQALKQLALTAEAELERVRQSLPTLRKHDALYILEDPVQAFALRTLAAKG